jgi:predicted nucleotide-binding protein
VEVPSDIRGLIYKKIETSVEAVGFDIIKELRNAGLNPTIAF